MSTTDDVRRPAEGEDRLDRLAGIVEQLVSAQSAGAAPAGGDEEHKRVQRLEEIVARLAKAFTQEREDASQHRQAVAEDREANAAAFLQIKRALTALNEAPAEGVEEPPGPVPWSERATAQQWHDLATWADWLGETYELKTKYGVYSCWPAHPGIVEEIAALWDSWRDAARRATTDGLPAGDNDAMAFWHDRYLAPWAQRVQGIYAMHACQHGHVPAPKAPVTDRDLLPPLE